ncbi:hypothetical protein BGZ60DRAFT_412264 [Tricladium varicosporioides]|nr:hypothetical protein BGZ60DRAFT_412264 [Hymenoscyphus varicosporioides]
MAYRTDPTLLGIPIELKRLVFNSLFSSITTRHGFETTSSTNTSLLRTCRHFYKIARPIMLSNITLYFSSTCKFLDCLTTLTSGDIAQLRYIRTKSFPFPLYRDEAYFSYTTHNFSSVLPLFPGLQLDLLTVEDCYHDENVNDGWGDVGTYMDAMSLILSKGWKELHYITPTTEFMTSRNDNYKTREAQPTCWDRWLKENDGKDSGAEVKMYVSKESSSKGAAEDPERRMAFSALPGHLPKVALQTPQNRRRVVVDKREVMVVAKRGKGVSYIEDGMELDKDIEQTFQEMKWAEIKKSRRYVPPEDDPCAHL